MLPNIPARRRWLLVPGAAIAGLLWLSVAFLLLRSRTALPAESEVPASIRPDLAGTLGVNLESDELTSPDLDRILAGLAGDGIRWLRFTIRWDRLEPVRGQLDWAPWDRTFAVLGRHPELRFLVVLDGSPAWARAPADADNPLAPPHERADFGAYAAAVARRYGAQIRYYQIWHEPNIAPHWGARPADPADYVGLLREGAVRIRAADEDAQIVVAVLAPTIETGGANLSDIQYLDELYGLGGRAWFDIVAAEPFGFSEGVEATPQRNVLNFARVRLLREVMLRHGDAGTPIWGTAFGWNALPVGSALRGPGPTGKGSTLEGRTGQPSPWGQVSEAEQARYAAAAVELAATHWSWLGPLFWAANCPQRPADDPWLGFALCAPDGSPRPVRLALADVARGSAILPPGDHAPDHPALHYDPGWRITPQAADPGRDGDTLRFAFYGTGLALRVQRGPYWAYYRITVDGLPANALPKDETGSAYLVLYDPLAAAQVVTVARGLPAGRHEARVEARGGWGQWALQGIVIYDQTAVALRGWAWVLLAVALLASAAWGVVAWPWLRTTANRLRDLLERAARLPEVGLWAGAIILALVFAFSRWLVVDMATLAGLGLLFMVRPGLALPLTAAAIPFWPAPKLFLGRTFSLYEVFIWVAVAAGIGYWVLGIGCGASRSSAKPPSGTLHAPRVGSLDWPVLALLASGLLSTIFAEHSDVAWREFRTVFLDGALFYWLITRFPLRRVETRSLGENRLFPWSLVNGLLLGMVAVSLLGLWQLVTGQGRVDVEGVWRVRGLYGSPNNLALVLDRIVPLTLALAAFEASRLPSWGALARKPDERGAAGARLFCAVAALITATACLATFSKGALLLGLPAGIGLVLLAGAWRMRQRWPLWMLAGLAVAGILALLVLLRTSRFADLFNFQAGTSFFRLKLWQGAWQMGLDHPWLGVGPDNFLYAYRTRYVLPSAWQELNLSHPHNLLLDLWTRLGITGLLAGGWAIVLGFRRGWYLLRSVGAEAWPLALGLLGGLAATVAHGLIDNSLFLVDLMALFMFALGVMQRMANGE